MQILKKYWNSNFLLPNPGTFIGQQATTSALYAAAQFDSMIRQQPLRLIIYCFDQNECVYDILLSICHHFVTLDLKYLSVTFALGTPS